MKDPSDVIRHIFVAYIFSKILVRNQKLLTPIIHGTEVPLYTIKYILLHISPYMGHIYLAVENKF